jgi:hypothetical protein
LAFSVFFNFFELFSERNNMPEEPYEMRTNTIEDKLWMHDGDTITVQGDQGGDYVTFTLLVSEKGVATVRVFAEAKERNVLSSDQY